MIDPIVFLLVITIILLSVFMINVHKYKEREKQLNIKMDKLRRTNNRLKERVIGEKPLKRKFRNG